MEKKSLEQLAQEMDEAVETSKPMTEEEKIEYDAEFGYPQDSEE